MGAATAERMVWRRGSYGDWVSGFAYSVRESIERWGEPVGVFYAYFASSRLGEYPTLAKAKAAAKAHSEGRS